MLDYDYEDIPIGRIQNNLIISFVVALIASMLLSCMAEVILQGLRVNDDIDAVGMKAKRKLYIPIGSFTLGIIWCAIRCCPDFFRKEVYVFLVTAIMLFVLFFINRAIFHSISKTLVSQGYTEANILGRIATIPLIIFSISWVPFAYFYFRKIGFISRIALLLYGGILLIIFIFCSIICAFELRGLVKYISVRHGNDLQNPSPPDGGCLYERFREPKSQITDESRFTSIKYFHVGVIVQLIVVTIANVIFILGTSFLLKELLLDESVSNSRETLFFTYLMYLLVFISNLVLLLAAREITIKKKSQKKKMFFIGVLKDYAVFLFIGFAMAFLAVAPLHFHFSDIFEDYFVSRRFTLVLMTSFLLSLFFVNYVVFHLTANFLSPYTTKKSQSIRRIALLPLTIFCISWIPTISCFYMEDSPTYSIFTIYLTVLLVVLLATSFICSSKMIRLIKRIQKNLQGFDKDIENLNEQQPLEVLYEE